MKSSLVLWLDEVDNRDVGLVGGKNASLGELIKKTKIPVPGGFATTSLAYKKFIEYNDIDLFIRNELKKLKKKDIKTLKLVGKRIRNKINSSKMPKDIEKEILLKYAKLSKNNKYVAVRSSATAEDLPDASFAGQQETFLNVTRSNLMESVKKCYASLFTDRAISYRIDKGFNHMKVALSVGIQIMVNSEKSGVMFTINPDSGFRNAVIINASYGLGEMVVQGTVSPDEFTVFKPSLGILEKKLGRKERMMVKGSSGNIIRKVSKKHRNEFCITDSQIRRLSDYAIKIEKHYKRPMDIEWALEGKNIFIVQARPETVQSMKKGNVIEKYVLEKKGKLLITGISIGEKIGQGKVNVIRSKKFMSRFKRGEILVTEMTDPDWEPLMKMASAIVTDKGGKTSHAAIVSRELGIPCIIDTYDGSNKLKTGSRITVDCTAKVGRIWSGKLNYKIEKRNIEKLPKTRTKIYVNVGVPDEAYRASKLPVDGIGLAREEFIITSYIREHPLHMIENGESQIFTSKLAEGIAKLAAPFYPRPIIVRFSDFKTNEYAGLKGGVKYEPLEKNPMMGWRGASRYTHEDYQKAFRLECKAIKIVRENMGLTNVNVMIPFCRTIEEGKDVIKIMHSEGLRKSRSFKILVMAEIPSNVILADKFAKVFDGFSIGSNDLTQFVLGLDRDSSILADKFDEQNEAVKNFIVKLIKSAKKHKKPIGICGEAPSNYPDFTKFLVKNGITSISVNPDVAIKTKMMVHKIEKGLL